MYNLQLIQNKSKTHTIIVRTIQLSLQMKLLFAKEIIVS